MLNGARIGLFLLSALSASLAPACGRAFKHDGDVSRAISAPDHVRAAAATLARGIRLAASSAARHPR
jgi:hypothetical protein